MYILTYIVCLHGYPFAALLMAQLTQIFNTTHLLFICTFKVCVCVCVDTLYYTAIVV